MSILLCALWIVELIHIVLPIPFLGPAACAGMAVYLALAMVRASRSGRILCLLLLAAGLILAGATGHWAALYSGFETSLIFAAFLPTVQLLRSVAENNAAVETYRRSFARQPRQEQMGWLVVGSTLLGSVLTAGAMAVLAPLVPPDTPADERRRAAAAIVCGVCLGVLWSPFYVAIPLVSTYLPQVPLWQVIGLGLVFFIVAVLVACMLMVRAQVLRVAFEALAGISVIIPGVLLAAALVISVRALTTLSTLESAVLVMPLICAFLIRPSDLPWALRRTRERMAYVGEEVAIMAFAVTGGAVLQGSPEIGNAVAGLIQEGWPTIVLLGGTLAVMVVASLLSVHPVIVATFVLAVLPGASTGLPDLALVMTVLVGWSFAGMLSWSGLPVIVASSVLKVPTASIVFGHNLIFVAVYGILSLLGLAALIAILS